MKNDIKLSIQVSLNGLSFCILDTATNSVLQAEKVIFAKKLTPYGLLKRLKSQFSEHDIRPDRFSEVVVVHRNNLFGLVPRPLFDADELPNYLKFNSKILANDHIAYDELEHYDVVNVFVPLVNINNYIYEGFGTFTFKHSGTVILESLPIAQAEGRVGFVHIFERQMDIAIVEAEKLLLFNSFEFVTKEDFLYYLLFTIEQLQLDTNSVAIKLFGDIEENDDLFELCYRYIRNVRVIAPNSTDGSIGQDSEKSLDFTVLNAF